LKFEEELVNFTPLKNTRHLKG